MNRNLQITNAVLNGATYASVGKAHGITGAAVRRIVMRACRRLNNVAYREFLFDPTTTPVIELFRKNKILFQKEFASSVE